MYENLVKFVSGLSDEALGPLPLKDIALYATRHNLYRGDSDMQERHTGLRQTMNRWVHLAVSLDLYTEEARQKLLPQELCENLGAERL